MTVFKRAMIAALAAMTVAAPVMAEDYAIVGGKVVTVGAAGTIDNATVLVSDGKITAVGANVTVPAGYTVIDASGKWVTPGFMNAYTSLGLVEIGLQASTADNTINRRRGPGGGGPGGGGGGSIMPLYAAFEPSPGFNPMTPYIPVTRIEGVTRAVVVPGINGSVFGGQAFTIDLSGGWDSITGKSVAMVGAMGLAGGNQAGRTRGSAYYAVVESLREAAAYTRRGARSLPAREQDSYLPAHEARALGPVVSGAMPFYVQVGRASDILEVLKLTNEFQNLDLILRGAAEGWMVADEIAAAGVPVVLDTHANLPSNFDQVGATMENAARLDAAGVSIIIGARNLDSGGNARLVAQAAGNAIAHGLSWDAAMRAVTVNPASAFGLSSTYGTLEPGKDADIVVWDGDPFEVMSNVDALLIRGTRLPIESRQTKLRDRYLDLSDMKKRPPAYRNK